MNAPAYSGRRAVERAAGEDAPLSAGVHAAGLLAPGLDAWPDVAATLTGTRRYDPDRPLPPFPPGLLPPNERRRATAVMKLVLASAAAAIERSGLPATALASVFASSAGDAAVIDRICQALLQPQRPVSPTHFHNSVHNAPSGYWSIGCGCERASTSVSAHDGSFAAGLLEAVVTVNVERTPVLLVGYDYPPASPIDSVRHFDAPCAAALILTPDADAAPAALALRLADAGDAAETALADPALERLRRGNPAARALPLLRTLAGGDGALVTLPYLDERALRVDIAGRLPA